MKALVLEEYSRLTLQEVARPIPAKNEVLVKVKACAICGSDAHGFDGSTGRRIPPIIMGHEASGEIVEVGPNVDGWQIGDRVTFDSMLSCGSCEFCLRGEINLCDSRVVYGVSCNEFKRQGAFTEYIAVNVRGLFKIPEGVSYPQAAMAEPISIAAHGVNRSGIREGDTAVVIGAGIIGLLTLQVLRARNIRDIIVVDIDDFKLETARSMGASHTFNSRGDAVAEILKLTNGRGVDVTIDAVGVEQTGFIAIKALRKGGTAVLVGNLAPFENLPIQDVVTRELSVLGSCAQVNEYAEGLQLIADKKLDVDSLISARIPLEEGTQWFEKLRSAGNNLLKVMFVME